MQESTISKRFINKKKIILKAEEILSYIGCDDIDPRLPCKNLSLSRKQMIEWAKAINRNPRILILDEATSALKNEDIERINILIKKLKENGMGFIYITHNLQASENISDMITILRNGKKVETFEKGCKTIEECIDLMIGHSLNKEFPSKQKYNYEKNNIIELKNIYWSNVLKGVNISLKKGEIIGIGGLDGQGQKETLLALFGILKGLKGEIIINGKVKNIKSPRLAKNDVNKISLIPEDRKTEGLHLKMSIKNNISLASLNKITKGIFINEKVEKDIINKIIQTLNVKFNKIDDDVDSLSGGNQQKVVLAKWLINDAQCLLLVDPTRGIDIGTKQELYIFMRNLAKNGTAILMFTTDISELIGLCDRVYVMYDGKVVRELEEENLTEHNILKASFNII